MPSTTRRGEKRKQATMATASPGGGRGPYSLPRGGPVLTVLLRPSAVGTVSVQKADRSVKQRLEESPEAHLRSSR